MIRISRKRKSAGITPNDRVIAVIDYVLENRIFPDQQSLVAAAGITTATLSRIKSGAIRNPTMSTLMRINDACGGIFNLNYLRGKSKVMLAADVKDTEPVPEPKHAHQPASNAELSSYANSALASKDETIDALKSKLADRDQLVDELREQLAEKRRDKTELQDEIYRLRKELSEVRAECDRLRAQVDSDALRHYPFPVGVAEPTGNSQPSSDDDAVGSASHAAPAKSAYPRKPSSKKR